MNPKNKSLSIELEIFMKENHEKCTQCGASFREDSAMHLGYFADGQAGLLCDSCSSLLAELVQIYIWSKKHFERPRPNEKLWRYMDLAKLISMLDSSSLFFAAGSSFNDPFEGAKGVIERKERWDEFYSTFFREVILSNSKEDGVDSVRSNVETDVQRLINELSRNGCLERDFTFISCWYNNEYESEAMWKLYAMNVNNAVAVQTTAEHLYEALGRSPRIDIGKVQYIDYSLKYAPLHGSFWCKRMAFEHEHEVRAVIKSLGEKKSGIAVPINIDKLIDAIYISPYAPQWFESVVRSVLTRYGISKPLKQSQMLAIPFY